MRDIDKRTPGVDEEHIIIIIEPAIIFWLR